MNEYIGKVSSYNKKIEHIRKYQMRLFGDNSIQKVIPEVLYDDELHIKRTVNETSKFYRRNGFVTKLKERIRERDSCICQLSGETGVINNDGTGNVILDVHHIDYDKTNINDKNLITLSHSIHSKTNKHRVFWEYYLRGVIKQIYNKTWTMPIYKEILYEQLILEFN